MNIPTLPTDNLYKFIAIFGLVLFALGLYLDYTSFGLAIEKRIEYSNDLYKAYVESKYLKEYSERMLGQFENLVEETEDLNEQAGDNKNLNLNEINEKYTALNVDKEIHDDRLKQLEMLIGDYEKSKEIVDLLNAKKRKIDALSTFLQRTGGALVLMGFLLWYFLHQRFMDAERKWKGMIYADKLKKREQQEKEKKKTEPNPEPKSKSECQEPETETESKSDS